MALEKYMIELGERAEAEEAEAKLSQSRTDTPACADSVCAPEKEQHEPDIPFIEFQNAACEAKYARRVITHLCTAMADDRVYGSKHALERGMYFGGGCDPVVAEFTVVVPEVGRGSTPTDTTSAVDAARIERVRTLIRSNSVSINIQASHMFNIHLDSDIGMMRELLGGSDIDFVMFIRIGTTGSMSLQLNADYDFRGNVDPMTYTLTKGRNGRHCSMNHDISV